MGVEESEIVVEEEFDDESGDYGIGNVYGIDKNSTDSFSNSVALEFTRWSEWLEMEINELSLREVTELEIIAHCLYEMTYTGYDEDEIQMEFSEIKKIVEEYKNQYRDQKQ